MIRSSKLQSRFSDFKIYLKPVCPVSYTHLTLPTILRV